jgi:NADH dehydrogenase (ubiquinone) 1 beta subcomplex subunit 9
VPAPIGGVINPRLFYIRFVMDKSFAAAVKFYKPVAAKLSHRQQVMRLYRKSLRQCDSWAESRAVFNVEGQKIRDEFNANKDVSHAEASRLMREAQDKLAAVTHPDPYIRNYMPGGTLFMRNPAVPSKFVYPDGPPEGTTTDTRRYNIDFSRIPKDQKYANKVFVDSANKSYWIEE